MRVEVPVIADKAARDDNEAAAGIAEVREMEVAMEGDYSPVVISSDSWGYW